MDDLHNGFLGCLGLMFVSNDLDLVSILVRFVGELHLDVKVAADLGNVCASLSDDFGMVFGVDIQHQRETAQLLNNGDSK